MAIGPSKEAGRLDPVDNRFTMPYNDRLIGPGELAMTRHIFVQRGRVLPRCEREAMIDRNTKMPIAGPCDVSILSRSSAHYPWRSLHGGATGAVDNRCSSSSLIADEILPNQPGPPLL